MAKAKAAVRGRASGAGTDWPTRLLANAEHRPPATPKVARLLVKSGGRVLFVRVDDIDWIEAADYYVKLHVGSTTHMLRESMSALESTLDPAIFFRIHRSAIVNLDRIQELRDYSRREDILVLRDGTRLRLTRGRRAKLTERLGYRR